MMSELVDTPSFSARILLAGGAFLRRLGIARVRKIARCLGWLLWHILPRRRKLAIQSIQQHLNLPEAEARKIARESFMQNALSFLETAFIPLYGFDHPYVRIACPDLKKAMSCGEYPVVAITAHLGAWELLAGLFGDYPQKYPHIVVVRHYKNAAMNDFTLRMRSSRGSVILGHRNAVRPVLHALKKNGMVAFLVDHNTQRDEALFMPFLGEIAAVNKGPAVLAVRANARVFGVFLVREKENYVLHIDDLLDTKTLADDYETKILHVAQAYTQSVENMVRHVPEQWFWMHRRWKTKPNSQDQIYS